ncbi:SRPBCC family protein [Rhodococcus sp. NPDC047139]|uniref:SRPBCC family protein n=1 Tax=Rhodococcus sp. NPDC047139 TaxID=3155141 RepID=UPI00340921DB
MKNVITSNETNRRTVGHRTVDGREAKVVTVSRSYRTSVEDLWEACTDPRRIPRWFLPVEGDLEVGGRYQLEGNADGEILTCDPPRMFTATWEFAGRVSWIEVSILSEPGGRARLELSHIAYPDEHWQQYGPGAVGIGWDQALLGLELYIGSGEAVDPDEFMSWSMSEEGLQFVRDGSAAWCDADIVGGEDPRQARAAADRTSAFYMGG